MPKDPQELLARWASDEILDPYGPMLGKDAPTQSSKYAPIDLTRQVADPALKEDPDDQFTMTRTLPLTTAELTASTPMKRATAGEDTKSDAPRTTIEVPPATATESPNEHASQNPPGETETNTNLPPASAQELSPRPAVKRGGGSLMVLGQILAYIGVLSLTIGSTFVLWGFFGDKPHYAPMGWLVLTAGQMLLFLGIVTLVSGGIEQTTSNVDIQFEALNDHILRIERAVNFGNPTTQPMAAKSKYDAPSGPDSSSEAAA